MWDFLSEFTRRSDDPYNIVVVEEDGVSPPRQYQVNPRSVLYLWAGSFVGIVVLTLSLVAFTPLRQVVLGIGTAEMEREARMNALRLAALQDSLEVQRRYVSKLQYLFAGEVDTSAQVIAGRGPASQQADSLGTLAPEPESQNWSDHEQPALSLGRVTATEGKSGTVSDGEEDMNYLPSLQLPVLPPVEGFQTRGYDARTGHYAVDIAVEEGTMVRSVGDGYVIFADWTHDGGYTIAVQHADGYVSIYKHNKRLLKHLGDRVRDRETLAVSGNSGEVTTGPHLHFELWKNGLAQDPSYYFLGLENS